MLYLALAILTVVLIVLNIISVPFFFKHLAEKNILFTTVKEGTVNAIMRGESFERFIMSFTDYHLNVPNEYGYQKELPDWEIVYHGRDNTGGFDPDNELYDNRHPFLKKLGIFWVGWPWSHAVYVYAFEWNETKTDEEGKEQVSRRHNATSFAYVMDFTYAIKTDSAETRDLLPTDELTLVTVAIRNPYRALFSGEDWMKRVTAAINGIVREFIGSRGYGDLISSDLKEFSKTITDLTKDLPDEKEEKILEKNSHANKLRGLKKRYGIEIRMADLQTIELTGEARALHEKATTAAYVAEQEAKVITLKGEAEASVIEIKGKKEAIALSTRLKVIKEHGEAGVMLAGFDALQETSRGSGNTIVWANSPVNALSELLKAKTEGDI